MKDIVILPQQLIQTQTGFLELRLTVQTLTRAHVSLSTLHLLGFVEAVNFINEQDGLSFAQSELILRLLDHLTDVIGGRAGGRQRDKTSGSLLLTGASNYVS